MNKMLEKYYKLDTLGSAVVPQLNLGNPTGILINEFVWFAE